MRTHSRGRRAAVAVAAVASMSMSLAACGGGGDSASDSKEVTIWASMDQPVIDGLEKALAPKAEEAGLTVKWSEGREHQPADHDQDPGQRHPRHRVHPAAGRRGRHRGPRRGHGPRRRRGHRRPRVEHGARHPRRRHGRRQALRPAGLDERQEPGVLQQEGLGRGRLQGPRVHRRAQRAHRADQGRRRHPLVHGHRVRHRHRLARHRLVRGPGHAVRRPGRVQRLGDATRRRSTPTSVREAAAEFEELMFTEGNVLGGRKAITSTNFGTAGNPMFDEPEPGLLDVQAGQLHHRVLPGGGRWPTSTPTSASSASRAAEAGGENPVLGGGDLATLLSDKTAAADVIKLLSETDIGNDAAGSSSFISPHKDFDVSLYPDDLTRSVRGRGVQRRPRSCSTVRTRCPARSVRAASGGR